MPDQVAQSAAPLGSKFEYETIESIHEKFAQNNFTALEKINIYGVITYVAQPKMHANKRKLI